MGWGRGRGGGGKAGEKKNACKRNYVTFNVSKDCKEVVEYIIAEVKKNKMIKGVKESMAMLHQVEGINK